MPIRRKTLLIIGLTLAVLLLILFITLRTLLLNSYNNLENHLVQQNVERVLSTISDELTAISSQTADYAFWDDTYVFMENANEDYAGMMTSDTLANLNINLMLWVNTEGEIVFGRTINVDTLQELLLPAGIERYINSSGALFHSTDSDESVQGIVVADDGNALLIASRTILTNDQVGPSHGTLVFGRFMDEAYVQHLSDKLHLTISLQRLSDTNLPKDLQTAARALQDGSELFSNPLSETQIGGYSLIQDVDGNPILILEVQMPREVYAQGQASINYFLLALFIIGIVFAILTLLLLDRIVLSPLAYLSQTITDIRNRSDLSQRILMRGKDEFHNLAENMNVMLEAIGTAQQDLKDANQQLEYRVTERTAELSQANSLLEQEITKREQAQIELAQARDRALEALRLRTQILANISHDARTPLNIILLRAEFLQKAHYGPINDKQKETLDSIMVNASQLLGFFNNLLDEAQINANKMKLKDVEFAPARLLQDITVSMAPLAERKGLQLQTVMADDIPPVVRGDPDKLAQILANLTDNAIKFTNQGNVCIAISRLDADHWSLEVSDTGCGIPLDAQSRIFEAFWQVDGSPTREVSEGVGLGLSIVRQLATLMGGQVAVKSQIGQGSTFTVTLPLYHVEVSS